MEKEYKPYIKSWNKGLCVVCLKPLEKHESSMCTKCDIKTEDISIKQLEEDLKIEKERVNLLNNSEPKTKK